MHFTRLFCRQNILLLLLIDVFKVRTVQALENRLGLSEYLLRLLPACISLVEHDSPSDRPQLLPQPHPVFLIGPCPLADCLPDCGLILPVTALRINISVIVRKASRKRPVIFNPVIIKLHTACMCDDIKIPGLEKGED